MGLFFFILMEHMLGIKNGPKIKIYLYFFVEIQKKKSKIRIKIEIYKENQI